MPRRVPPLALAVLVLTFTVPAHAQRPESGRALPFIVTAAELATLVGQPNLVFLHVGEKTGYEAGHIPGARYIALDMISKPRAEGTLSLELPSVDDLRATFEQLGISDDSRVVLYFGKDWLTPTSRVFFTLDYLGLGDRVSYLDGGLPAWQAARLPVTTELPTVTRGSLTPHPRTDVVVDAAWVAANRTAPGIALIDARDQEFYSGANDGRGRYTRPGHIAGARSIPFASMATESGTFLARAELNDIFVKAGVKPDDAVVSYCHIGQQATLVYFVARALGHQARLYDGSFEEWDKKTELPVEK